MAESSYTDAFLQSEQGDAAFRKLMASPVAAPRKRIRRVKVEIDESVTTHGKSLADICRGKRKPYVSPLAKPCPTYRQWLGSIASPADADREAARAKAEWADRKAGLYGNAAIRRRKQIARGLLQAEPVPYREPEPLPERKPSKRTSRSGWPSFRDRQLAGLIATGEWEYLADIGAPSFHPGSRPQLLLAYCGAEIIPLPIVEEVEEIELLPLQEAA